MTPASHGKHARGRSKGLRRSRPAHARRVDAHGAVGDEKKRPSLARGARIAAGLVGVGLVGGAAYAATSWVVGLNGGSSSEGQAATVSNLTIAAVASPSATNLLYPGGTGDVVLAITNPNAFSVTITGVNLPTNTTYATGFTGSNLTGAIAGCAAATSDVLWSYATSSSGSAHTLTTPLIVGANSTLTVTLTNDASMTNAAPAACEAAYFSMPAMTGIAATGGTGTATTSPAVDSWTS